MIKLFEVKWVFYPKNACDITDQIEKELKSFSTISDQEFKVWDYDKHNSEYPFLAEYLCYRNIKSCLIKF